MSTVRPIVFSNDVSPSSQDSSPSGFAAAPNSTPQDGTSLSDKAQRPGVRDGLGPPVATWSPDLRCWITSPATIAIVTSKAVATTACLVRLFPPATAPIALVCTAFAERGLRTGAQAWPEPPSACSA